MGQISLSECGWFGAKLPIMNPERNVSFVAKDRCVGFHANTLLPSLFVIRAVKAR